MKKSSGLHEKVTALKKRRHRLRARVLAGDQAAREEAAAITRRIADMSSSAARAQKPCRAAPAYRREAVST